MNMLSTDKIPGDALDAVPKPSMCDLIKLKFCACCLPKPEVPKLDAPKLGI